MDVWSVFGGSTDECMNVQMDGWTDTGIFFLFLLLLVFVFPRLGHPENDW